jgi:mitogen-activated protein kinase 1/3
MEYFNQDLRTVFTNVDPEQITDRNVVVLMYNLLCAMRFMHSSNVIHRDLKPSNILITNEFNIKICDFGLSRTIPSLSQKNEEDDVYRIDSMTSL